MQSSECIKIFHDRRNPLHYMDDKEQVNNYRADRQLAENRPSNQSPVSPSIPKSVNQSVPQSVSQSTIHQSVPKSVNHSVRPSVRQSATPPVPGSQQLCLSNSQSTTPIVSL